jgi:hypothetical protein
MLFGFAIDNDDDDRDDEGEVVVVAIFTLPSLLQIRDLFDFCLGTKAHDRFSLPI